MKHQYDGEENHDPFQAEIDKLTIVHRETSANLKLLQRLQRSHRMITSRAARKTTGHIGPSNRSTPKKRGGKVARKHLPKFRKAAAHAREVLAQKRADAKAAATANSIPTPPAKPKRGMRALRTLQSRAHQ